jgi:glutathionylspermidine synthase
MIRRALEPRSDWQAKVAAAGMSYHTIDGEVYWDESACYRFTTAEVDQLESATAALYDLCCQAADEVIRSDRFAELGIPGQFRNYIIRSWEEDEPSLYGRFDLRYDGVEPPKLLEFNGDTPTALLEASVVQWFWLQERFPGADQFNSIHEKLIASWQSWPGSPELAYFASAAESEEDLGNLEYLRDTAIQAGLATKRLFIEEIGWDSARQQFVDLDNLPIMSLFKLYPWEWLLAEQFGPYLPVSGCRLIEPAWKLIMSCKGILPLLWELFPGHPNLLPAFFDEGRITGDRVIKPLYSREGSNIRIVRGSEVVASGGSYGREGTICQQYLQLPCFGANYPVIGSWVIGGEPAGIGIREDSTEITCNTSRFVPHYFTEG